MADRTAISWTDDTWNPIAGCSRVSEGCRNCYVERMAARGLPGFEGLAAFVDRPNGTREARWTGAVMVRDHLMDHPLRRRKPRRIFVNSMADLFHDAVPDEVIDRIFAVMALAPHHTFQILTKRPERMRRYLANDGRARGAIATARHVNLLRGTGRGDPNKPAGWPLANVWMGVSVEDQVTADVRIPYLLDAPAAIRFVSYEPALGPIDLTNIAENGWSAVDALKRYTVEQAKEDWGDGFAEECAIESDQPALDLVIMGGESGPNARPMHPDWARQTRDQCAASGVPFFFKQWGEWKPTSSVDGYWNGPQNNERRYPNSEGLMWLSDGRVCLRDFSVAKHATRIKNREAFSTRAVEVDQSALADFEDILKAESRLADNPLGAQWMYRVSHRAAGRLLDGVEHNGMPEVRHG